MKLEKVLREAEDRIGFGLDICNGENEIAKKVGTGFYITYEYNHSDEEVWQFVIFKTKEKARVLAEYWASCLCTDDDISEYHKHWDWLVDQGYCDQAGLMDSMERNFSRCEKNASWDHPVRVGQNIATNTTVGYAHINDFIQCMPLEQLRQFAQSLFEFSIITGGLQDH